MSVRQVTSKAGTNDGHVRHVINPDKASLLIHALDMKVKFRINFLVG